MSFHGRMVVEDVAFDIPRSGISVLIGRSGSGKTTILRALNRLNEEFAGSLTCGEVDLDLGSGLESIYDPGARTLPELRRRVGMVFQTPNVLPVSVGNNIAMPLELVAGCPKREAAGRVELALRAARLWDEVKDRMNAPADSLSGGQQQRLCIARALALEPAMLLVDEPTASLDVHAASGIEDLLLDVSRRLPVVMSTHGLDQALRLAAQFVVLDAGRVGRIFGPGEMPSRQSLVDLLS